MKKVLLSIVLFLLFTGYSLAQVPDAFNYQSVVRNTSGELIANQSVSFKISIIQNTAEGTVVYAETHSVTTNDFGLANLIIGQGTLLEGVFSPGGWGAAPHFIKVELDPAGGSSFSHLGTSQLLSVPYAFHAHSVSIDAVDDADADPSNELQTIQLSGDELTLSEGGGTVVLPSGGSSLWTESGSDIYRSDGNVGIGTASTGTAKLQISMNSTVPNPHLLLEEDGHDFSRLSYVNSSNPGKYWTWAGLNSSDDKDSRMNLWYYNGTSGGDLFSVSGNGNIGIGTTSPGEPLVIGNNITDSYTGNRLVVSGSSFPGVVLGESNDDRGFLTWNTTDKFLYAGTVEGGTEYNNSLILKEGDVVVSNELHSDVSGSDNMMPFAYGHILSAGTKNGCTSNVGTVTHLNTGQYRVNISGLGSDYTVVVTPNQGVSYLTGVVSGRDSDYFVVAIWNTRDDLYRDGGFSFIVYKP